MEMQVIKRFFSEKQEVSAVSNMFYSESNTIKILMLISILLTEVKQSFQNLKSRSMTDEL